MFHLQCYISFVVKCKREPMKIFGSLLLHVKVYKGNALFIRIDTEIRPVKVFILCQLLTTRMGLEPILSVKVAVTIDTMLKLLTLPNLGVSKCEQGLTVYLISTKTLTNSNSIL